MTRAKGTAAALAGLALSACASLEVPAAPDLGVEPPAQWTALAPGAEVESTQVTANWWLDFGDTELSALIEQALEDNHDLGAAAARVDAAAAQARIAGADLSPQVSLQPGASRRRQNFIGLPIPGNEGGVLSTTSTSFNAGLNVSWEADLWGRIRAGRDAATSEVAASVADLAGARLAVAGRTAKAWFGLVEAELQASLAETTLESRSRTRERIRRRYELGTRNALDLRLAITNEATARANLATRGQQLDAAQRQLQLLLSRYPGTAGSAAGRLLLPLPPSAVPALLPADLVDRRPDLAAIERRLSAAGLRIKQARAALYPSLSLTGSTGRVSTELEDLLESDLSVWSLAANLLQPIFQGGRLRAGVDLAESRQRELAETYSQSLLTAFAEVELALAAEVARALQVEALEIAVTQSTAAEALAENRYQAGLADYLSLLESQREATVSRTALLTAERQRLDARVDLYLALGGGFDSASRSTSPTAPTIAVAPRPTEASTK